MIVDISIVIICCGLTDVVFRDLKFAVQSLFEIGLIENLIFSDMAEQFQEIIAIVFLLPFLPVEVENFHLQPFLHLISQIGNIEVIRIEGCAVDAG